MAEKGGANAAVAAITAKAKLAGLWREKVAQTDPSGENAPRYIISDRPMTEFEIAKTTTGYASTPTILVSFNGTDGSNPWAGLIADARGNLFGTTENGGTYSGWSGCVQPQLQFWFDR